MPATDHFSFNLMGALAEQIDEALCSLDPAQLTHEELKKVPNKPGIYRLFHHGDLVYIGKAEEGLKGRLGEHREKISGRTGISLKEMKFDALHFAGTWVPVSIEKMLIKKLPRGQPKWNGNGFGNRDPGRRRDTVEVRDTHFDALYPANMEHTVKMEARRHALRDLLSRTKKALPYVFRFESDHPDYEGAFVELPENPAAEDVFEGIAEALPLGWRITALPGYVIMYREDRRYRSEIRYWASVDP